MFDDIIKKDKDNRYIYSHKCAQCESEWIFESKDTICWNCGSYRVMVEEIEKTRF